MRVLTEKKISTVIKGNGLGQRFGTGGLGLGWLLVCFGCSTKFITGSAGYEIEQLRWTQTMENTPPCG